MELVELFKALGDENRIRILNVLRSGELCVCEIEHILEINQSNVSRHLNRLYNSKIISYEKKSQRVFYKINEDKIKEYPFIKELIYIELIKINQCRKDTEKLLSYNQSGMTSEQLKECEEH